MTNNSPLSWNWAVYGAETEPVEPLQVRAGPLRMFWEPGTGFVRRISLGGHEVLRGIYAAVRDHNWGTVSPRISDLESNISQEEFTLAFNATCRRDEIHFVWEGLIQGHSDGTLRYEFDGEARTTFLRNRIGFCVLHPIRECAGVAARQTRVDGRVLEGRFPIYIEPQLVGHSSFHSLRKLAHQVSPGSWAEIEFEGDVFEMEDQRNWTDASFKTYCTPLALPFPVEIKAGTRIRQAITLRLCGHMPAVARPHVAWVDRRLEVETITVPEAPSRGCPAIGLGLSATPGPLSRTEIARLSALRMRHLRADLRLSDCTWPATWERARRESEQLGVPLELAIHLPNQGVGELAAMGWHIQASGAKIARVLALREGEPATSSDTLRLIRQTVKITNAPFGAGTDANFCELNREQALGKLASSEADFIFWSINPQVHAFDNLSLMETLEAQGATVLTARAFAGGKPLAISPVTFKPRFNAVATKAAVALDPGELPPQVDPRQLSLFAAAWTLGCVAALAGAGAESITCFETTGWRGIMEREQGSPLPEKFPSTAGAVFPVYQVLAELADCLTITPCKTSANPEMTALSCVNRQGGHFILLANLALQTRSVRLVTRTEAVSARWLTPDNFLLATQQPERFRAQAGEQVAGREGTVELILKPYAVGRIDCSV